MKAQEMAGTSCKILIFWVFLAGFALLARAQGAEDSEQLRGDIDNQESGILAEGAELSSGIGQRVVGALEDQAKRDLGIVVKPLQNKAVFTPQPTMTARASAAPTLDASDASIEQEIEKLRQDARAD